MPDEIKELGTPDAAARLENGEPSRTSTQQKQQQHVFFILPAPAFPLGQELAPPLF